MIQPENPRSTEGVHWNRNRRPLPVPEPFVPPERPHSLDRRIRSGTLYRNCKPLLVLDPIVPKKAPPMPAY